MSRLQDELFCGVDGVALVALCYPADSALHLSAYWATLIGKIMCLAMVAWHWIWYGICEDFEPWTFVILPWWICDGYVSDAKVHQATAAGVHAVLSWDKMPWFWVGTDNFVGRRYCGASAGSGGFIFGFCLSLKNQKTCFLDYHLAMVFAASLLFFP